MKYKMYAKIPYKMFHLCDLMMRTDAGNENGLLIRGMYAEAVINDDDPRDSTITELKVKGWRDLNKFDANKMIEYGTYDINSKLLWCEIDKEIDEDTYQNLIDIRESDDIIQMLSFSIYRRRL